MRFFQEHEAQRLTTVVNQLALQVQGALQDILINPVLDLIGVLILGYALFRSLAAIQATGGNQVWVFFAVIVLIALVSPWLVSRLSEKLRSSSQGVQQQNLLLASLVGGAMGAPEEIQALRAEHIFNQKFSDALAASLQGKIVQVLNVGRLNLLNRLPGDLVLASLMGLSVFIAASGMLGIDAGVVAGLMALTPAFMGSIQGFSALTINLNLAWPAIQTVGSIGFGAHPTWVSYLVKNQSGEWVHTTIWKVPAHTRVNLTIEQFDSGSPLRNQIWGQVAGVAGGAELLNGKPISVYDSNSTTAGVGHTFSIPTLGINLPLVALPSTATLCSAAPCSLNASHNIIKASFVTPGPGEYPWQCFVPCGLGWLFGNGGPMSTVGYMGGFLDVAA